MFLSLKTPPQVKSSTGVAKYPAHLGEAWARKVVWNLGCLAKGISALICAHSTGALYLTYRVDVRLNRGNSDYYRTERGSAGC